jgi:hypothetical protein
MCPTCDAARTVIRNYTITRDKAHSNYVLTDIRLAAQSQIQPPQISYRITNVKSTLSLHS